VKQVQPTALFYSQYLHIPSHMLAILECTAMQATLLPVMSFSQSLECTIRGHICQP
jgi:hypothetical protein